MNTSIATLLAGKGRALHAVPTTVTVDGDFTTTLDALGRTDFVSFGATYFNEQVQNLIVAQFVPVDTAVNIGSAQPAFYLPG